MEENKVVALLPEPPKEVNISYNQFLFEKRKELKLSRRKFAKLLKKKHTILHEFFSD